jgi:hypothetical protein
MMKTPVRFALPRPPVRSALIGTLVVFAGCSGSADQPSEADLDAIRDTVMALEKAMHDGIDGMDCEAGLQTLGDNDPVFVGNGSVMPSGALFRQICTLLVAPRTGADFDASKISAYVLSEDAAYVVREGFYAVTTTTRESESFMVISSVWHRAPDGWEMVHMHESTQQLDSDLPSAIDGPILGLEDYVGGYEVQPGAVMQVSVEGDALLATLRNRQRLFPLAPDTFFSKVPYFEARFQRDSDGQVSGVEIEQGGAVVEALKIPPS